MLNLSKHLCHLRSNTRCLAIHQGPPGKDGLPGHPGQRGETVSIYCPYKCFVWSKRVSKICCRQWVCDFTFLLPTVSRHHFSWQACVSVSNQRTSNRLSTDFLSSHFGFQDNNSAVDFRWFNDNKGFNKNMETLTVLCADISSAVWIPGVHSYSLV